MKMLIVLFLFVPVQAKTLQKKTLRFANGPSLKVEVADTFADRNQGLMNRTSLAKNEGMLFVFESPQIMSFWMKNTFIPLSIGYFDKDKVLKEIHQMKAQSMMEKHQDLRSYKSKVLCKYALEVNQGWFKKNKIKIGQKFTLLTK